MVIQAALDREVPDRGAPSLLPIVTAAQTAIVIAKVLVTAVQLAIVIVIAQATVTLTVQVIAIVTAPAIVQALEAQVLQDKRLQQVNLLQDKLLQQVNLLQDK